jgi:carbon monoxide dehydrogenase subunit G
MEITGSQSIPASCQRVWEALNDPAILQRSLPGCESVERVSSEEFKVVMAVAIGPLRARFNGRLKLCDVCAPQSCTLVFEGQGGVIGFGKGQSSVRLTQASGQTELAYGAQAQVGGKLAQVGSRLIDTVARKMAGDFFTAFKAQLASGTPL